MTFRDYLYRHPLVILQILGWLGYIIIDIFAHVRVGYFFYGQSVSYGIIAFILTTCVSFLSNRNKSSNLPVQLLYFIFLLFIAAVIWNKAYQVLHFQTDKPLFMEVAQLFEQSIWEWGQVSYMALFLFFAWGGLYVSAKWYMTHQVQQKALASALLDKKQAQLETLRYQLNPHFLFNVLNSIDVSILKNDKTTAHNMVKHLSHFLRSSLKEGESDKVTMENEFEVIRNFISIEQLRFSDNLKLQINLSEDCREALIPPMLLQPLVENAVKYAWSQNETGHLTIYASKEVNSVKILIINSKVKEQPESGLGTGLKNAKQRLALAYGTDAYIVTVEHENSFEVKVHIPWEVEI